MGRATADGIRAAVESVEYHGAVKSHVAEQSVEKLGLLANENDTMIVLVTVGDASSDHRRNVVPRTTRVGAIPCWGNSRLRSSSSRVRSVHLFRPLDTDDVHLF